MDSFVEYLYHLLPSPLGQTHKKANAYWKLCRVLGSHLDRLKETILNVREQTIILTCPPEMLEIIGQERRMPRLDGEEIEQYRVRLTMKNILAERAGTAEGIVAMVRSLGYESVTLEPLYQTDPTRWAEATLWISGGRLVIDNREIIQQQINEIKQASALVTLAHEELQTGSIYIGIYMETAKIIEMSEV